jgi:HD-GYP domain-containing protein (c-di-GMP phosphodiesterase class II)
MSKGLPLPSDSSKKPRTHFDTRPDHLHPVVAITGISPNAIDALHGEPLIILRFPFKIGRLSRLDPDSTMKQDLLLPDNQPYHISRSHLVIEREQHDIILRDTQSRCGTVVNGRQIGARRGYEGTVTLTHGTWRIALGGEDSGFVFSCTVRHMVPEDLDSLYAPRTDKLTEVRAFYHTICKQASYALSYANLSSKDRHRWVESMVRAIAARQDQMGDMQLLASLPTLRSDRIAHHCVNTAILSMSQQRSLVNSREELICNTSAILEHDIGMYQIERELLEKQGPLSAQERALVQRHTSLGSQQLEQLDNQDLFVASLARDHHERPDGSGYPRGIRTLDTLAAHLSLIDTYEALIHDRPQRPATAPPNAIRTIIDNRTRYDRGQMRAFLDSFTFYPVASLLKLNSGEIGQVMATSPRAPLSPTIRILVNSAGNRVAKPEIVDLAEHPMQHVSECVTDRNLVEDCAV